MYVYIYIYIHIYIIVILIMILIILLRLYGCCKFVEGHRKTLSNRDETLNRQWSNFEHCESGSPGFTLAWPTSLLFLTTAHFYWPYDVSLYTACNMLIRWRRPYKARSVTNLVSEQFKLRDADPGPLLLCCSPTFGGKTKRLAMSRACGSYAKVWGTTWVGPIEFI